MIVAEKTLAPESNAHEGATSRSVDNRNWFRRNWKNLSPAVILLVMLLAVFIGQPSFFAGGRGVIILASQSVPVMLLALGQTLPLMTGGIDLSTASLAVFSAILVATLIGSTSWLSPVITILVGAAAGFVVGWIASTFQVPTFAVSLGALGVWTALALVVSGQTTVYVSTNKGVLQWLQNWKLAGIPARVFVGIAVGVLLVLVLTYTRFGRNVRAIGFNEQAAILSGVNVVRTKAMVFAVSGACAAGAGIMLTAQQGTATASGVGTGLLLPGIAAAIVGGVSISGGVGNPLNVILGALIITLVPIGSSAVGVDTHTQQIVYGVLVILAVLFTIDRSQARIVK